MSQPALAAGAFFSNLQLHCVLSGCRAFNKKITHIRQHFKPRLDLCLQSLAGQVWNYSSKDFT
jgi:hypothetical protein